METLKLDIVTPQGKIFSNNVKMVILPGSEGEFGVLPGHVSVVSALKTGVIEIQKTNEKKEMIAINWGYVKIDEHTVDILIDGAVSIGGNSESEIAQAIEKAKKLIEESLNNQAALSMVVSCIEDKAKSLL